MEEKAKFLVLAESGRFEFKALCQRYGISRRVGYKWLGGTGSTGWPGWPGWRSARFACRTCEATFRRYTPGRMMVLILFIILLISPFLFLLILSL
ncbi:hypothetical protein BH09VER1_BH09VER1_22640 [soil metagenome]